MKTTTICLVIFVTFALFLLPSPTSAKEKDASDEIIQLQKEIRELKQLFLKLAQLLPEEQRKQLETIIRDLEQQLEKKKRAEKFSTTTRKHNRLKQSVEEVKKKLEELTGGIEFSGFFDVTASGYKTNPNIFALGDFELDMEKSFGENFQVAAALVFNDDGAELAVGFIDFHLFGGPISARGRLFTEKGLHFQVGRFDVPFGNDWQYYASADRVSVSAPLSTEFVMDGGYNDVGLRILRGSTAFNYTLFMLRGIEEGFSLGGRVGATPFNNPFTFKKKQVQAFECGVSYLHDYDRDGNREERAFALDFESKLGPLRLQGEYLRRDCDVIDLRMEGYHISAFLDAGAISKLPVTFFGRYDFFQSKPDGMNKDDPLTRITAGINVNLFDISVLKLEYFNYLKENDEFFGGSFHAQLVITF